MRKGTLIGATMIILGALAPALHGEGRGEARVRDAFEAARDEVREALPDDQFFALVPVLSRLEGRLLRIVVEETAGTATGAAAPLDDARRARIEEALTGAEKRLLDLDSRDETLRHEIRSLKETLAFFDPKGTRSLYEGERVKLADAEREACEIEIREAEVREEIRAYRIMLVQDACPGPDRR